MKEAQKNILDQYLALSKKPTLRYISNETGIQMTRVFRLLNGSAMKLSEYQIFCELVQKKLGFDRGLSQLASECVEKLSSEALREIEGMLKRKLALWGLKQNQNNIFAKEVVA